MNEKIPIILLVGPTAVGKTEIGLQLAQLLKTDIISADSMQVYRYLDIGTAKPTKEQQRLVKHWMIDIVNPDEPYNAAFYSRDAEKIIVQLFKENKIPLVVGGSGLYIRALIDGLFPHSEIDLQWRQQFRDSLSSISSEELHRQLEKVDPVAASRIHPHDRVRILRALEIFEYFSVPISELQKMHQIKKLQFQPLFFGLTMDIKELYAKINFRVDKMLEAGWVKEVEFLRQRGYNSNLKCMQGLGYRRINEYLDGKIDYKEMVRLIKRDTRRYAKRQLTWFKRDARVLWKEILPYSDVYQIALELKKNATEFISQFCNHLATTL